MNELILVKLDGKRFMIPKNLMNEVNDLRKQKGEKPFETEEFE